MAETATTHLGQRMLAEKRRHQLLATGNRGLNAVDSVDVDIDIEKLVNRPHGVHALKSDSWWNGWGWEGMSKGPPRNLLHVKTTGNVETMETWTDVFQYLQEHPTAIEEHPRPARQNRIFVFNTPRSDLPVPFLRWLDEFEKACVKVKKLNVDSWRIFADLIRYQHRASSWHFVWNLDPSKHHRFLMTKPQSGPRFTASFAISMAELCLISSRLPQLRRSGFRWRPTWPTIGRSTEASDISSDYRTKYKYAPRGSPCELLLTLDSQFLTKRPLLYMKHIVLDVAYDPSSGCMVDITTSDVGDHITLLPLLYKRDFQPIDLVVRLFDQEVDRWTEFIRTYKSHIKALRSYLYDNRVQKATINTILASLKLVDNLVLISQNNAETIDGFLSPDVYKTKSNLPQFWLWRHPSTTSPPPFPADSTTSTTPSHTSTNSVSSPPEILLQDACPSQYASLLSSREYFLSTQETLKTWESDLRGQMQLIFNLISIDEAYRSREQNTSLKRLSWITFIFLPMLFMSSLFGMNIDLLKDDPEWWWYFVWTVPGMFIVLLFWAVYRIWDQRRVAEEELPFKIA